jgi:hypothetical protein
MDGGEIDIVASKRNGPSQVVACGGEDVGVVVVRAYPRPDSKDAQAHDDQLRRYPGPEALA